MRLPYQVFILDSGIGTPAGLWQGKETSKEVRGRPQGLYYVYFTTQTAEKYSAAMYSGQFCRLRFYRGFIKSGLVTGQARQKETKTEIGGG